MCAAMEPSASELLDAIESKGFALTLEARGTPQKWVTGKNLFMGLTAPNGLTVRDAYGSVAIEIPLRVNTQLSWTNDDGTYVTNAAEALRNAVKRGTVRRSSHLYSAMSLLVEISRHEARRTK